jgi:thiamine-monophosphate kinase
MPEITFTPINEIGEFGLISHLMEKIVPVNKSTIKGISDDCAVIDYGSDYQTVVSTDMFVDKVHFDLMYTPLNHLGYKVVTGGISDIYAMNAIAEQVVISFALSNKFSVEMMDEFYAGIFAACKKYGVDFAGGDTTTIAQGLVINVTALGKVKKEDIVYRNGASKNDLICVTGDLGAAYLGLLLLEREKKIWLDNPEFHPKLEGNEYVLERNLKPECRKDIIGILHNLNILPTAMIDISDGLSSEIIHICTQSKTGCRLFEEKLPIDPSAYNLAREFNLDPTMCMLNGGEDYELLFTIKPGDFDKINNNPDVTVIGHITDVENDFRLITKSGNEHLLKAQGWKAFGK